jgi:tripartite-type tricarboxylate transporter receptor subunit TctC
MKMALLQGTGICCAMALGFAGTAHAQHAYPSRTIEIVVPFAAGGSVDITMRLVGASLAKRLGQSVVIVNKAGAGATLGMIDVAKSAPDGHTLGAASFSFAANTAVLKTAPYDLFKDFAPITMVARSPMVLLVNPKTPVKNVAEFVAWVKAAPPGSLNYGSVGAASSGHLMSELFLSRAGIKMVHVPFRTGPLPPLAQGDIHLQFSPIPTAVPWLRDGRLRAFAVSSREPYGGLPGIEPVSRTLQGFDTYEWPGLVAPAATPRAIIDLIQREVVKVLAEPEILDRMNVLGSEPVGSTPEQFAAHIKRESELWKDVVTRLGLKIE